MKFPEAYPIAKTSLPPDPNEEDSD